MYKPFFTIVIPTYNRGDFILKTVQSLTKQSFTDFEIIIVDDGSTDNTEEVVKPVLSDKIFYFKKENAERAAARNFGSQKAKGNYINWFDSDDFALENHLKKAKELIDMTNPSILHLGYKYETQDGTTLKIINNLNKEINKNLYKGNTLSCNGVFVKREIALENPFNENRILSASEDYELWLRLASKYNIEIDNSVTSVVVQHEGRSVISMTDPSKLTARFEIFIQLVLKNPDVQYYYKDKLNYLAMKNYLWLAVDLAYNGHKKLSKKYLRLAVQSSKMAFFTKSFYASLKHIYFSAKK